MNILQQVARRLERLEALDKVAKPLAGAVGRAVRPRVMRNLLSGTDLGASPAPDADRPADRSVGDVGPAGRRRRYRPPRGPQICWSLSAWWPPCRPRRPG